MTNSPDRSPELVLLHSIGLDAGAWQPVAELLAAEFTVSALNGLGHGGREISPGLGLQDWVADLHELIRAGGDRRVGLVGVSMGGVLAMAYAAAHPDTVSSLVVADSFAAMTPAVVAARLEGIDRDIDELGMRAFAENYVETTLRAEIPAGLRAQITDSIAEMPVAAYREVARVCFTADVRPVLGDITCPTLVLVGSLDQKTPRPLAEEIAAGIAGARLEEIEGAGHLSNVDMPARFASAVRAFNAEVLEGVAR